MITWERLIELEPRLLDLYQRVVTANQQANSFCEDEAWWGTAETDGFKRELVNLIGWDRTDIGDPVVPELHSSEAYEIAYTKLYSVLPPCLNCPHHPVDVQALKSMDYRLYLRTEHWKRIREAALTRANYRCQICSSAQHPQVHHRTYVRRGEELPEDLTVLCEECHRLFHKHSKLSRD